MAWMAGRRTAWKMWGGWGRGILGAICTGGNLRLGRRRGRYRSCRSGRGGFGTGYGFRLGLVLAERVLVRAVK